MKIRILLLFAFVNISILQMKCITFNQFTTDDGLSHISVMTMYKDSRGFIWMGTRNGLNVYDGNKITSYLLDKDNPTSLFSNSIMKIVGDGKNKIYVLCREGVAAYNLETDKFQTLLIDNVSAIYYDNGLFIARQNTISLFVEKKQKFIPYFKIPNSDIEIKTLLKYNDALWIGTNNHGLYQVDKSKNIKQILSEGSVGAIYNDSKGVIWVGTNGSGIFKITNKSVENLKNKTGDVKSLAGNIVRDFCEDNNGNIWIGTFNGLSVYDKNTNNFTSYQANEEKGSLSHSSIWSIIKDDQGTIWLGTYFGGVDYFNPEFEIYTQFKMSKTESRGLSFPIVSKMTEDKNDNLWICTEGGGLNVYNKNTGKFKWFKHENNNNNSILHNNVKALYYDDKNDVLWIGSLGGLNKLDIKSLHFSNYLSTPNSTASLPSSSIYDIVPYQNQLLLGTDNGVFLFDPKTGLSTRLFKNVGGGNSIKIVTDLLIDHKGTLWFSVVGNGVYSYRFDTQQLKIYRHNKADDNSLSSNYVNSIYEDSRKNIWFCTFGSGLDMYNPTTENFKNFDVKRNKLSSDCVYQICESPDRRLFVTTNKGFSVFDQKGNKFYNYNKENGFPVSTINETGLYISKSGIVYIGGMHGIISFNENKINFDAKPYKIYPVNLFVNGKAVNVNDETGILSTSLYASPNIKLKSKYNVFSIEFAISNFIAASRSEIEYKLVGFSDKWNSIQGQNLITYTNLNPGNYELIIKAKEKVGGIYPEAKLKIEILPPFYKSSVAYILYTLLLIIIIYFLLKTYDKEIKLKASLKYEQKQNQDIENLNNAKLAFFTNISHEFRTPLTLIIGQMESLLQSNSLKPIIYHKFLAIYKNGLQLMELITELLDFRKQEHGLMKIKVGEHNIVDFLYEDYLLFAEYANSKHIKFIFHKESDYLNVWFDKKQMQKVINNILSNAFKYTTQNDTISISVKQLNDEAIIEIFDSGSGIPTDALSKVFDRFYQAESNDSVLNPGTGIGLALSKGIVELHKGNLTVDSEKGNTVFKIVLKLGNTHFSENQIYEKEEIIADDKEWINQDETVNSKETEMLFRNLKEENAKILIVEDNDSLRELLVNIFSPFYTVEAAVDGTQALEKMKSDLPDLVLSDVVMPNMTGTELCKIIKNDIDTCHIPVVLLTARTAVEHNIEGLNNGADDYITKPFNTKLLISRCNNLVNSRIRLREKFSNQPQVTPLMLATNNLDKELLDKTVEVIERHIDDTEFSIHVFANEMGMSRTKLFSKIKAVTGQAPNDFVTSVRLKKAAFLLKNNPELNVTEISDKTGFSSALYFSRSFKKQYKISPMNYRKMDGV